MTGSSYPGRLANRSDSSVGSSTELESHERGLQEGIDYLVRKFARRADWGQLIRIRCLGYGSSFRSELRAFDRPHMSHLVKVKVSEPGTSADVWRTMLQNGRFSAPVVDDRPVKTGNIDELWAPIPGDTILRLVGDVENHLKDEDAKTIWNITLPNHILFPGTIRVQVRDEKDGVYGTVLGEGLGNWAWLNERGGPVLFTLLLENLRDYVSDGPLGKLGKIPLGSTL